MKKNTGPCTPRHRLLVGLAGALAVGVAALSLGRARAHESRPTAMDLASSFPEALDVDVSRFTANDIDWFDSQHRLDIFKAMGSGRAAPKVLAVFRDGSHSIFTDRVGTGGPNWNPRVKVATRQLALAFLNGVAVSNCVAVDAWSLSHGELVATFEKRVPQVLFT